MLDILFLDNHLLVVNKRSGLLSQHDSTGDRDLLALAKDFLKKRFKKPGNVYLGLVHRLDRPVSGVMVLARTSKAASRLSSQFRSGTAQKRYIAIVEGVCTGQGECKNHIIKKNKEVRIVDSTQAKAQYAELLWESIAQKNGLSLFDIQLKTGRPHQIRAQLAHKGLPILGDFRYGAGREFDGRNIALHCYLLGVEHPTQKTFMHWSTMPPATWEGMFNSEIRDLCKHVR